MSVNPNFPEDALEGTVVTPNDDQFAGYANYFGTQENTQHFLPDNKQYFLIKTLNEGDRAKFEKATNSATTMNSETKEIKIDVDAPVRRRELIRAAVVGWHLVAFDPNGRARLLEFSESNLLKWLKDASPSIVDDLVDAITEQNEWLSGEVTLEALLKEREDLDRRIEEKRKDEERKASFDSKSPLS